MATLEGLKTPPHDFDAEKSVLGAVLIDSSSINLVAEFLKSEHFYGREHQLVYSAMITLFEKQQPIDVVTIQDELKKTDSLKLIGGKNYLSDLINAVPTSAYIEQYGRIVKNHFVKRRLIQMSSRLVEKSFDTKGDVKKLLDDAETEIFSLSQEHLHRDFIQLKEVLAESFERLEEFVKKGSHLRGVSTGFIDLDSKLAGMQDSNLLILAARPGIGKTTMALNIALQAATKNKVPVGFFSLEMSKEELVDRLLVGQADIDAWRLKTGRLSDDDYKRLTEAMGDLSEAPIYIDDTPGSSILEMRTKARKLKMEKDIKLLVVDYLQLIDPGKRFDSRVNEVSFVSQNLKNLARELKIPVLALSQLSRAVEQRGTRKPQLSDLRESGCLTGNATLINSDTGEKISIKYLAERKEQIPVNIMAMDSDYKIKRAILTKAFKSGIKMTYLLKTKSGREIIASANHPFYKVSGWTPLDQLKVNDLIAVPREIDVKGKNQYRDEEIIFLAHMIGDGCFVKHQPIHYTSGDLKNIKAVEIVAKKLFKITPRLVKQKNWFHLYLPSPYRLTHNKHHPFVNWLKKQGLDFSYSYEKVLPNGFLQLTKQQIKLFLCHLWATDGNISWKKLVGRKPSASIYYSSTSKILIQQIQYLLLRLGIISSIHYSKKKDYRTNWQVHIQGKENQLKYLTEVGCYGKRGEIIPQLIKSITKIVANTNNDVIPKEVWKLFILKEKDRKNLSWRELAKAYGTSYSGSSLFKNNIGRDRLKKISKILESKQLELLSESDIYWDKIKEITKLKDEEVYDATISDSHNFVANDVIVHNSIEQDADVVMFLYLEQETEDILDQNKKMVKLYIAKHRNGATGEMDLMFRGDRVKFYSVEK
ncbi:Replicative DNA helicase [Candidatus Roizmanbacteria bacterium]|nr:Replicative DNA helicase [Candidatus Roizmanbacteria bacterium]